MIKWQEDYSTGIDIIDFDHKNLFNIFKLLGDAIDEEQGDEIIEQTIGHLISYAERHFKREEGMFFNADYENADAHCEKHRELEKVVHDIAHRFKNDRSSVNPPEILKFVENWLVQHILVADMGYVQCVQQHNETPKEQIETDS
jgi:hemerythrin-like metal-binding protein